MDPNHSPGTPWKKPSDVMKKFRKSRKRASLTSVDDDVLKPKLRKSLEVTSTKSAFNPFKCQNSSKSDESNAENIKNRDIGVFSMFREIETNNSTDSKPVKDFTIPPPISPSISNSTQQNLKLTTWSDSLVVDWSLKYKARFLSAKQFSWTGNLKTSEEASGITGFVRCLNGLSSSSDQAFKLDTSKNAHFHQCCLVWSHPHLPWLKLFPRQGRGAAKTSDKSPGFSMDSEIQEKLYLDWCDSFRSLYQLLRARQCPYFYVCSHKFTALFRAAGIAGINEIHALLTPSTRGLREVLRQEGVVFTLPLKKQSKNASSSIVLENTLDCDGESCSQFESQENDEDEDNSDDEEHLSWLEEMGLETSTFPELNPNRIKMMKTKSKDVDHRPESMLYVEGVEVQGFFNFILNNRNCISTTGPLAGVPPTLLAPTAFQGATLCPLQIFA